MRYLSVPYSIFVPPVISLWQKGREALTSLPKNTSEDVRGFIKAGHISKIKYNSLSYDVKESLKNECVRGLISSKTMTIAQLSHWYAINTSHDTDSDRPNRYMIEDKAICKILIEKTLSVSEFMSLSKYGCESLQVPQILEFIVKGLVKIEDLKKVSDPILGGGSDDIGWKGLEKLLIAGKINIARIAKMTSYKSANLLNNDEVVAAIISGKVDVEPVLQNGEVNTAWLFRDMKSPDQERAEFIRQNESYPYVDEGLLEFILDGHISPLKYYKLFRFTLEDMQAASSAQILAIRFGISESLWSHVVEALNQPEIRQLVIDGHMQIDKLLSLSIFACEALHKPAVRKLIAEKIVSIDDLEALKMRILITDQSIYTLVAKQIMTLKQVSEISAADAKIFNDDQNIVSLVNGEVGVETLILISHNNFSAKKQASTPRFDLLSSNNVEQAPAPSNASTSAKNFDIPRPFC